MTLLLSNPAQHVLFKCAPQNNINYSEMSLGELLGMTNKVPKWLGGTSISYFDLLIWLINSVGTGDPVFFKLYLSFMEVNYFMMSAGIIRSCSSIIRSYINQNSCFSFILITIERKLIIIVIGESQMQWFSNILESISIKTKITIFGSHININEIYQIFNENQIHALINNI